MEPSSSSTSSGTQTPEPSSSSAEPAALSSPVPCAGSSSTPADTSTPDNQPIPTDSPSTISSLNCPTNLQPSTSRGSNPIKPKVPCECQPSTSSTTSQQNLISPSKIFSIMINQSPTTRPTQTPESRKHKATEPEGDASNREKRPKIEEMQNRLMSIMNNLNDTSTQTQGENNLFSPWRTLQLSKTRPQTSTSLDQPSTSNNQASTSQSSSNATENLEPSASTDVSLPSTSNTEPVPNSETNVDDLLLNIRRTAEEEVRNRILPIIRSVPENDRPVLIR